MCSVCLCFTRVHVLLSLDIHVSPFCKVKIKAIGVLFSVHINLTQFTRVMFSVSVQTCFSVPINALKSGSLCLRRFHGDTAV